MTTLGIIIAIAVSAGFCVSLMIAFDPFDIFWRGRTRRIKVEEKPVYIGDPINPVVIKGAKIKPTTCQKCGTVYQACWSHIRYDFCEVRPNITKKMPVVDCPLCKFENPIEIEKPEE